MTARPFRVLGLQQVALGAPALEPLLALWVDLLGVAVVGSYASERENVDERIARLGRGPLAVELDLMRPLDAEKSPKVHQPPLNHLGLWVDDLVAAVAWLAGHGVRFTPGGIRRGAAGHDVCFIHPKGDGGAAPRGGEGVLIELVQAPPEVVGAFDAIEAATARPAPGGGTTLP
jgi:lactoylglutathione lyase